MPRYAAFLRGINVGGHRIKMDELRRLFEALGFGEVSTFIASGNVVFESPDEDTDALERRIEGHLESELGYGVATFIRPVSGLGAITKAEPFGPVDPEHSLHVVFLHETPDEETTKRLSGLRNDMDDFHVEGRRIYWLCRGKLTDSPAFEGGLAKVMDATPTTMRKITTLRRIVAKYAVEAG